jgi:hypothetical protein
MISTCQPAGNCTYPRHSGQNPVNFAQNLNSYLSNI